MKLLLYSLILLPLTSLKAQFTPERMAYDRGYETVLMANKIHQSIWIVNQSSDNWVEGDTVIVMDYNNEGKVISDVFISGWEEEPNMKTTYNYDKQGLLLSTFLSGFDLYPIESTYKYKKNKLISSFSGGAEARKYTYLYEGGKIVERIGESAYFEVDEEGNDTGKMIWQKTERTTYHYNTDGKLQKEEFYYQGEVSGSITYMYNLNGRIIQTERFISGDSEPQTIEKYDYNDAGLMIGSTTITYDGLTTVLRIDNKQ